MSKCPNYNTPMKKFVGDHLVAIKIYNGFEDVDRESTVSEANQFWGHLVGKLNVELERGLFDKSLLPIAEEDYEVDGMIVIKKGQQYKNWGQVRMATASISMGKDRMASDGFDDDGKSKVAIRLGKMKTAKKKSFFSTKW